MDAALRAGGHHHDHGVRGGGKLEDLMMLWFGRSDVNKLIRILRRARDAAYGADE